MLQTCCFSTRVNSDRTDGRDEIQDERLGKLLQNDDHTLEQCHINDYDLITCRLRRGTSLDFGRMNELFLSSAASAVAAEPPTTTEGMNAAMMGAFRFFCREENEICARIVG